jgi:LigD, primase-polymerase domain
MSPNELTPNRVRGEGSRAPSVPSEIRRGKRVVRLSNLEKPYWPDERITKGDLLRYYRDVAPAILPHIRDRPFTMKRYPDGWQGKPFFRKDVTNYAPAWVKGVTVSVTSREQPPQRRTIEVRCRRPRVRSVSTFSYRSSGGTRMTTRDGLPPKSCERSPARTQTLRRPSGRRRSDEGS